MKKIIRAIALRLFRSIIEELAQELAAKKERQLMMEQIDTMMDVALGGKLSTGDIKRDELIIKAFKWIISKREAKTYRKPDTDGAE